MSSPGAPHGQRRRLRGHRATPLGRSPFGPLAPPILAAVAYALAVLAWAAAGERLPGGRWLAVHLFTLGVLTNLIPAFSDHFGRALTRTPGTPPGWLPAARNAGILAVLAGIPTGTRWAVALGATVVTATVLAGYWRLRQMRKQAVGARFGWVVRAYERAHGAFVHGAVLGLLMGTGLLPGAWHATARLAHLHVNVLGWGGLTLLATVVFFGPTMVRTRILPGADVRAARALRYGASGLTAGVLLLLVTAVGGTASAALRVLAGAGLGVFAWAATVVCLPVVRVAAAARPSAPRWAVAAACTWFPLLAWADAAAVAAGWWRFLDALGLAVLAGVLFQAVMATLTYLAPMLRGRSFAARDRILARLERGAAARALAYNAGVLAVALAAAAGPALGAGGALLARAGWALAAAAALTLLLAAAWPVPAGGEGSEEPPRSQAARFYRASLDEGGPPP